MSTTEAANQANPLLLDQQGGRLYVTFNRPERRNALNDAMLLALEDLISRLENDHSVRVVIIRGAGGHFCAGGDIRERRAQTNESRPGVDIAMERNIRAAIPGLAWKKTVEWMGHRPSLADSLPVIGPSPALGGAFLAFGHDHVGLTGGPKTGRLVAQLVAGRRPNTDLAPYSPARFN